jgi:arylsulfatase A-like enzyme
VREFSWLLSFEIKYLSFQFKFAMSTPALNNRAIASVIAFLIFCISSNAQRPNIIFIMSDDMGYADIGVYGGKNPTPNLDKLAANGIRFTNAYAAAPLCTPTRTALMTGKYPARTAVGLIEPLTGSSQDSMYGLSEYNSSLPAMMKANGYNTALIGKWHLGFLPQYSPRKNGFDYFYGIHSGAADYISHKGSGRRNDLHENETNIDEVGYLTDLFTDKAVEYVSQKHDKPYLLMVTYTSPHWPWQTKEDMPYADSVDYRAGGSKEKYAAMLSSLDESVGKIMQAVERSEKPGETIIIFTNDNGGERYSDQGGLMGSKQLLQEGGLKVPAIVCWPGKINPNSISNSAIITMDWMPTFLGLADVNNTESLAMDGMDIMSYCLGKRVKEKQRSFYWRNFQRNKQKAVLAGKYKYFEDETGSYLYDLTLRNPETYDVKKRYPKIYKRLKKEFSDWEKTVLEPIPLSL